MDLLPPGAGRVYPVGAARLRYGGNAPSDRRRRPRFSLTHPKNEIPKTYLVKIEGSISDNALNQLRAGVELDGKLTNKSKVKVIETDKQYTKLHVTINEGRNAQVRRMFETVGKEVTFLKRIKIGDMGLGSLERGKVRKADCGRNFLSDKLIKQLRSVSRLRFFRAVKNAFGQFTKNFLYGTIRQAK